MAKRKPRLVRPATLVAALDAELQLIDVAVAGSALAMSARSLAAALDGEMSAAARAACARELREHLAALRELAPPPVRETAVDELAARAARKLAAK